MVTKGFAVLNELEVTGQSRYERRKKSEMSSSAPGGWNVTSKESKIQKQTSVTSMGKNRSVHIKAIPLLISGAKECLARACIAQ